MRGEAKPLVSVCVPTYNDGPFLLQSLQSITRQTYERLEILVGDDGSTDNTAEVVRSCADPRIHYHRNPANLGQFANVNELLRRACGEFVAIYHSDDWYAPTIVEKEVEFLREHPEAGAVFTLNRRMDDQGRVYNPTRLPPGVPARTCFGLVDVMRVLLRHKNRLLCGPSFLGRAEVFRKVGLFNTRDYAIAADLEMWLRILTRYPVAVLDEPLMHYRKGVTQVSSGYNRLRTFEDHFFAIIERYLSVPGVAEAMDPASRTEYAFHRCDDETFRAANLVIRCEFEAARKLVHGPFPWRTFLHSVRRRKLRVLLLRWLIRTGLAVGAVGRLARYLRWVEYGVQG
jgi:glycosyltransferase involved in cell wall biosynthesis